MNWWGSVGRFFRQWVEPHHRLLLARDEHLMRQINYLHAWVANINEVVEELRRLPRETLPTQVEQVVDDHRKVAAEILKQARAAKEAFPTKVEDL